MEGLANMGQYPCFFTEIGIPFDMDNKRAYIDGNYSSQIGALDANMFALEGALAHFTLWHYSPLVNTMYLLDYLTDYHIRIQMSGVIIGMEKISVSPQGFYQ